MSSRSLFLAAIWRRVSLGSSGGENANSSDPPWTSPPEASTSCSQTPSFTFSAFLSLAALKTSERNFWDFSAHSRAFSSDLLFSDWALAFLLPFSSGALRQHVFLRLSFSIFPHHCSPTLDTTHQLPARPSCPPYESPHPACASTLLPLVHDSDAPSSPCTVFQSRKCRRELDKRTNAIN